MIANNNKKSIKKVKNEVVYHDTEINIRKEVNGEFTFEIGNFFTSDVAEAVAFLMRNPRWSNLSLWNIKIELNYINAIHCLYWLSGGDEFWKHPECRISWVDAYPIILRKFESKLEGVKNKKTLSEIRTLFKKKFNLDAFYDFALSKGII